jgi:hypothetical protein
MDRLNRHQALWLARGIALGSFLLRLRRAVLRRVYHLRDIGLAHGRRRKRPGMTCRFVFQRSGQRDLPVTDRRAGDLPRAEAVKHFGS